MLSLSGHLGAKVADLVDGQLPAAAEERAWQHVLSCPGCRQAVEQEAAAKQRLAGYAAQPPSPPLRLACPLPVLGPMGGPGAARRRTPLLAAAAVTALTAASVTAGVMATSTGQLADVTPPAPSSFTASIGSTVSGAIPAAGAPSAPASVGSPTGSRVATPAVWVRASR